MTQLTYGVILKVNDLDLCRMFYRDVLGFGSPLFDSSFAVQFEIAENLTLTLEKNTGAFLEHASSATGWFFETNDLEGLRARLQNAGFPGLVDTIFCGGSGFFRGRDPENNVFYVKQCVS